MISTSPASSDIHDIPSFSMFCFCCILPEWVFRTQICQACAVLVVVLISSSTFFSKVSHSDGICKSTNTLNSTLDGEMPHADSALIPKSVQTKAEFWQTAYLQLQGLLHGQRNWVRSPHCPHKSTHRNRTLPYNHISLGRFPISATRHH